jgi:ubiquinone biosynthesis protein
MDIAKIFQDITKVARHHKVILPRDFVLLGKSLVMAASLARDLDPTFNLAKAASPHFAAILKEKLSPKRLLNITIFQLWSLFSLLQRLPIEVKDLIRRVKAGNLCITLRHESLDKYIQDLDKIANRLSFSIILASTVIASSLLTMAKVGPQFQNIPILGLAGYLISAVLGLWLVIAILRSGRM